MRASSAGCCAAWPAHFRQGIAAERSGRRPARGALRRRTRAPRRRSTRPATRSTRRTGAATDARACGEWALRARRARWASGSSACRPRRRRIARRCLVRAWATPTRRSGSRRRRGRPSPAPASFRADRPAQHGDGSRSSTNCCSSSCPTRPTCRTSGGGCEAELGGGVRRASVASIERSAAPAGPACRCVLDGALGRGVAIVDAGGVPLLAAPGCDPARAASRAHQGDAGWPGRWCASGLPAGPGDRAARLAGSSAAAPARSPPPWRSTRATCARRGPGSRPTTAGWPGAARCSGRPRGTLGWAAYHRAAGDPRRRARTPTQALAARHRAAPAPRPPRRPPPARRTRRGGGAAADAATHLTRRSPWPTPAPPPTSAPSPCSPWPNCAAASGDIPAARTLLDSVRALCTPMRAAPALARADALAARLRARRRHRRPRTRRG